MIFEEPLVEFVAIQSVEIETASGGTGGTDSCKGPASIHRNCSYFNNTFMDDCGLYVQGDFDAYT